MITRKAEYAIIALAELASHPEGTIISSKEIANRKAIPGNLVVQLTALLNEAGWISGTRGPTGGMRLQTEPAKINLRQVIELIDGPVCITRCLINKTPCKDRIHCSLRGIWADAQQSMLKVLEDVTIKDLAEKLQKDETKWNNSSRETAHKSAH
ncbi:MAG TPA: Rrf2 family transcriptional regulator [Candidatus Limnocylindrales bacterium]|nr:Rrf2 family transcriptional regulator [Candidatus Limnocylindrales bacterium]